MEYTVRKLRDKWGNLKDEIDPIRGRYVYAPFMPTAAANNYITVPEDKVLYLDIIEVENTDTTAHTFHLEDDSQNQLSLEYSVPANSGVVVIKFYSDGFTGNIHFVPDAYSKLKFRPSGYMGNKD